jgi:uncharacterized membrane protein (DUF4010 family)
MASPATTPTPRNPLAFVAALQMVALFQLVWFAVEYAQRTLGETGLLLSALLLGLSDVDALTASVALRAGASVPPAAAAQAIAVGIAANTVLKLAIALVVGKRPFTRRVSVALLGMVLALIAAALLIRWFT